MTVDSNNVLLMYYQDQSGNIIENTYANGSWSLDDLASQNGSIIVQSNGQINSSPLAVTTYTVEGVYTRQVFFINPSGYVMQTNSTNMDGTHGVSWTAPQQITTDPVSAGTAGIGLAACSDANSMNGVRVYYPSMKYGLSELMWQFNDTGAGWAAGFSFDQVDTSSGFACAMDSGTTNNGNAYLFMVVYVRNSTTKAVKQNYLELLAGDDVSSVSTCLRTALTSVSRLLGPTTRGHLLGLIVP